jgi:hypothetical protein
MNPGIRRLRKARAELMTAKAECEAHGVKVPLNLGDLDQAILALQGDGPL